MYGLSCHTAEHHHHHHSVIKRLNEVAPQAHHCDATLKTKFISGINIMHVSSVLYVVVRYGTGY